MTESPAVSRRSVFLRSLAAATVLAAVVGVILSRWNGAPREDEAFAPVVFPEIQGRPAVVLDDGANREYWGEGGDQVPSRVRMWLDALHRVGMSAVTITSLADWRDELLVLPHSYCLSQTAVQDILAGIEAGKGVVFVGPVGVRDADGSWLGWNRFHSIVGSTNLREYSGSETMFLVVSGNGPVGSLSSAGNRVSFLQREGQWGVDGLPGAAYWADYDRKGFPVDGEFHASVIGSRGSGRYVWVGFDPDLAAPDRENQVVFDRLVGELIKWGLSVSAVDVDLYPDGKLNALLFVMDTEWQFENASRLGELLESRGIRGGFMCVNEFAEQHPELVRALSANHDIGSHSEDHVVFTGQTRSTQAERLRLSAAGLAELSGQEIAGFRPPEELYDDATLHALTQTGFEYLLGGEATAVGLPTVLRRSQDASAIPLVIIPRIQRDDLYLANREQLNSREMAEGWLDDWNTVQRHRGIHYVSVHSTWLTGDEQVSVLSNFLDAVPLEDVWVPGPNELAEWWLNRSSVETDVVVDENGQYSLRLVHGGHSSLQHLGVWAAFEGNPRRVALSSEGVSVEGPDDRGAYLFVVERLEPGDSLNISVELLGTSG